MNTYKFSRGQSLVEVIIALGIIGLLCSGLVAGSIKALQANQNSRVHSFATKLVQEGIDNARLFRDEGWSAFIAKNSNSAWCDGYTTHSSCPQINQSFGIQSIAFTRKTLYTYNSSTQIMTVRVTVTWDNGKSSSAETLLSNWK